MKKWIDAESAARMAQAANWLQQLQQDADDQALQRWLDWCAEDPRNQQAFNDISQVWTASAEVPATPSRRSPPRALAAGFAGFFAVLLAGVFAWNTWWQPQESLAALELASPTGSNSRTALPDGSVVELGGRSQAVVRYTSAQREVRLLQGQLFVTVARDADRPFIVDTGELRVAAVGTAFDVLHESGRSVVTVVEGQIDVRMAGGLRIDGGEGAAPIRLGAGQQLTHVAGSRVLPVRWVDPATTTAWRDGILIFVDQPLALVMTVINRYADREVVIENSDIGARTFTGTARTDRIGDWLAALPDAFPVALAALPDGRMLLHDHPDHAPVSAPPP